jgi:hypothetical protein
MFAPCRIDFPSAWMRDNATLNRIEKQVELLKRMGKG